MYCTHCGTQNASTAQVCVSCGSALTAAEAAPISPPAQEVQNYLTHAIVLTLCCCWPFAIPAIYAAAKVNYHLGAGQLAEALEASRKARMWCWIAFGSGLAIWLLYFGLMIAAGVLEELG